MLSEIEQLLILQDRDQKIRQLRQELKTIPLERRDIETKLAAQSAKLESAKQRLRELEVERKNLELAAQSRRDAIAKFRTQQFETRKNEEFQALGNEIKRAEDEIIKNEDRQLELMEDAARQKSEAEIAEKEFAEAKEMIERQLEALVKKNATLEGQLKEFEDGRAQLASSVDEDLLDLYTRLFKQKDGLAVAPMQHDVCMGCHMKVTPQTVVKVRAAREIVNCGQCGRMLYPAD